MSEKKAIWIGIALVLGVVESRAVEADEVVSNARVEIPIEKLFTPSDGWDDNDHIQVVLHGALPNACYSLSDTTVEKLDSLTFGFRQFATKSSAGICADESTLPAYMQMRIPFSKEVDVGRLDSGTYGAAYNMGVPGRALRTFNVGTAIMPTIDSLPYANVTQQHTPDILNGVDSLKFTISGVMNSTCVELDPKIGIKKEDDV